MQVRQKNGPSFEKAILVKFTKDSCPWSMANDALRYAVDVKKVISQQEIKGNVTFESTDALSVMIATQKEKQKLQLANKKYINASTKLIEDFNERAAEKIANLKKSKLGLIKLLFNPNLGKIDVVSKNLEESVRAKISNAKKSYEKVFNKIKNNKNTITLEYFELKQVKSSNNVGDLTGNDEAFIVHFSKCNCPYQRPKRSRDLVLSLFDSIKKEDAITYEIPDDNLRALVLTGSKKKMFDAIKLEEYNQTRIYREARSNSRKEKNARIKMYAAIDEFNKKLSELLEDPNTKTLEYPDNYELCQ